MYLLFFLVFISTVAHNVTEVSTLFVAVGEVFLEAEKSAACCKLVQCNNVCLVFVRWALIVWSEIMSVLLHILQFINVCVRTIIVY